MGRRGFDSVSQGVARRSKARQKVSRASRSPDSPMSSDSEDPDSVTESKLMYVLELLPECSNEVIHKVHKAMEAAMAEEKARGDTKPR